MDGWVDGWVVGGWMGECWINIDGRVNGSVDE